MSQELCVTVSHTLIIVINTCIDSFSTVLQASRVLDIPPILTEQYPKGLGPTVHELGAGDLTAYSKTSFTMMTEDVEKQLLALGNPKQAILCGIEAHACIAVISLVSKCSSLPLFSILCTDSFKK